jgi:hypothetical protein
MSTLHLTSRVLTQRSPALVRPAGSPAPFVANVGANFRPAALERFPIRLHRIGALSSRFHKFHIQKLDIENQRGVRRNGGAPSSRSVSKLWLDDKRPFAAGLHGDEAALPALDYLMLAKHEGERLLAINRTVELLALDAILIEPAGIMNDAGLTGLRGDAGSDLRIGDLQARCLGRCIGDHLSRARV